MTRCKTGQFRHWNHKTAKEDLQRLARRASAKRDLPASLKAEIASAREKVESNRSTLAEHDSSCEQCAGAGAS